MQKYDDHQNDDGRIMMISMMMIIILMVAKMVHVQRKMDGFILVWVKLGRTIVPHPKIAVIIICMIPINSQWSC